MLNTNLRIIVACLAVFGVAIMMSRGNLFVASFAGGMTYLLSLEGKWMNKKRKRKKYNFLSLESDFTNSLIQLIAAIIKEDKKETDSEIRYVEKALLVNFSRVRVDQLIKQIKFNVDKKELNITGICQLIRSHFDTSSKVQLMHLLVGIASADGLLTKKEEKLLKSIAVEIRLPFITYKQILSMFRFRYEGQEQKRAKKTYTSAHRLKSAFSVLGLSITADEKEIKKAYRKLAVMHHPDKVAHLGEEVQNAANDKFLVISEAYELIKKKKGFS